MYLFKISLLWRVLFVRALGCALIAWWCLLWRICWWAVTVRQSQVCDFLFVHRNL